MSSNKNQEEPQPPKVGRPDGLAKNLDGAPEDVRYGVLAWLSVSSMQAMYAIVQFVANIVDPRALRGQVKEQSESMGSLGKAFSGQNLESEASLLNFSMLAWMLFAAALCAYLTIRAGRGGNYSRIFLNVGSIYLALQAILLLFSSAPSSMPVGFVLMLGILTILSGVAGVLGVWFMSRPGNSEWLGIPPAAEFEKYAEAVEKRRKEAKEAKAKKAKEKKDASGKHGSGPQGPQGPQRPRGPQGPRGPHGPGQQGNPNGSQEPVQPGRHHKQ